MLTFTTKRMEPISALSVCKESREVAISAGYKIWRLHDGSGPVRDIIWNPKIDFILFAGPHVSFHPKQYPLLLALLYPTEAKEATRIAIPSSHWAQALPNTAPRHESLANFQNMKELVIIVDVQTEVWFAKGSMRSFNPAFKAPVWNIPEDIKMKDLGRGQVDVDSGWQAPLIRVVRTEDEDAILRGNIHMGLRCFPCPDLGLFDEASR